MIAAVVEPIDTDIDQESRISPPEIRDRPILLAKHVVVFIYSELFQI